ncbi:MAG: DNA primase, partial [Planctomycetota bacterium]
MTLKDSPETALARIPEEVIQQLRESADLVEIIGREVPLKRSGASFKGLCPFHEEKTPSFHVFPESGTFKCFGCSEGGNVFGFLMKRTGMSFREALEEVSKETGIALPTGPPSPGEAEAAHRRGSVLDVLQFAAAYFRKLLTDLPAAESARRYLADRGFTPETLETFGVGFARQEYDGERSLLGYAHSKGIDSRILEAAGLVRVNERGKRYDFFRGRIMFPIRDFRGRVIGFGGRILDQDGPKYVNSPDSPVFNKSRELYGQDLARRGA